METLKTILNLAAATDFNEEKYSEVDFLVNKLKADMEDVEAQQAFCAALKEAVGPSFLNNTVIGHSLRKPMGYSGDFMIIDNLYKYHRSDKGEYENWDKYLQQHTAPKAVRNRKEYFKSLVRNMMTEKESMSLLNIASGPARDLCEVYDTLDEKQRLRTTCVDMDADAIAYATTLNDAHLSDIDFVNKNIFKFKNSHKYDLVWSAGLFDYFNDKAFVLMLEKMSRWVTEGGSIVVGNFNEDHNPSRAFMEIFGDWYLIHRTEDQLRSLALEAGFAPSQISVGREPENVNLFLHIDTQA